MSGYNLGLMDFNRATEREVECSNLEVKKKRDEAARRRQREELA